jgi:hypothetical protein
MLSKPLLSPASVQSSSLSSAVSCPQANQVSVLDQDLIASVEELKTQKQVFGPLLSIDDLVSPVEEK